MINYQKDEIFVYDARDFIKYEYLNNNKNFKENKKENSDNNKNDKSDLNNKNENINNNKLTNQN